MHAQRRLLNLVERAAGLRSHRVVGGIDVADAVEPRKRHYDFISTLARHLSADETGIASLGYDRRAGFSGDGHYCRHLARGAGPQNQAGAPMPTVAGLLQIRLDLCRLAQGVRRTHDGRQPLDHNSIGCWCHLAMKRRGGAPQAVIHRLAETGIRNGHHGNGLDAGIVEFVEHAEEVGSSLSQVAGGGKIAHRARMLGNVRPEGKKPDVVPWPDHVQNDAGARCIVAGEPARRQWCVRLVRRFLERSLQPGFDVISLEAPWPQ